MNRAQRKKLGVPWACTHARATSARRGFAHPRRRAGVVLVTALWITIIITAVVLVLARSMRVEGIAARNRVSALEADCIARGAEQYVLSQVEPANGDVLTVSGAAGEAIPVGDPDHPGYFWILRPSYDSDQYYTFGIVDEGSKLNLNTASAQQLAMLPGMSQDLADSIILWRTTTANSTSAAAQAAAADGADSSTYLGLPQPYQAKNNPFETVEELKLIYGMTPQLLWGFDTNHDGVVSPEEQQASMNFNGVITTGTTPPDNRGIVNYLTCWSSEPETRINVNDDSQQNTDNLLKILTTAFNNDQTKAQNVIKTLQANGVAGGGKGGRGATGGGRGGSGGGGATQLTYTDLLDLYNKNKNAIPIDDFKLFADKIRVADPNKKGNASGLVDIANASRQVIYALGGWTNSTGSGAVNLYPLDDSDADTIYNASPARNGGDTSTLSWLFDAVQPPEKVLSILDKVTTKSHYYSADIVAVSADGRAFKRVRIVVNATKAPAKIIYRRDLTGLGWPLDRSIQEALRAGTYQPPPVGSTGNSGSGILR